MIIIVSYSFKSVQFCFHQQSLHSQAGFAPVSPKELQQYTLHQEAGPVRHQTVRFKLRPCLSLL